MVFWFVAAIACTFLCPGIVSKLFGRSPGASNERFALFYTDGPTVRNYAGVSIDTNGLLSNTTAEFKFADGTIVVGNLTGHAAHFHKGIGYGNFSIDSDHGRWITVDVSEGAKDVSEFFEWLVTATQDGNVTAEELQQAINILHDEAETYDGAETL